MAKRVTRRWWFWTLIGILVIAVALVLVVVVPILSHQDQGLSEQQTSADPTTATAVGDDGRTRTISVSTPDGGAVVPDELRAGDHLVVHGSGFNASQGIYVAICVIPDSPEVKPGPCIGGAPQQSQDPQENAGAVQYASSNWINDDWAWRLFGSRGYDSPDGSFTAYLLVGDAAGDGFDCRVDRCGIVTRNDHTATADRVQDVYLPVAFATD